MANKDQQDELEQGAREWLERFKIPQSRGRIEALVALLAAQRAVVLEEVANEMARHPYWSKEAEIWIKHLRKQAKEGA